MRGENITKGYYRNAEATKGTFSDDGQWLKTGDVGVMHDKNEMRIVDRIKGAAARVRDTCSLHTQADDERRQSSSSTRAGRSRRPSSRACSSPIPSACLGPRRALLRAPPRC